ncbi:BON domain-containing protein [Nitrospira moscoviensis]|nr:BON domain-containing protein [Nitrospira moscoviensis]
MRVIVTLFFFGLLLSVESCAGRQAQETASADRHTMERQQEPPQPAQTAPLPPQPPPDREPERSPSPKKRIDPDRRETGQAKAQAVPSAQEQAAPQEEKPPAEDRSSRDEPAAEKPTAAEPPPDRVTALHQSESTDDVNTTARIRQALVGDDQLSFRAKNVMIVTDGDQVVLRGRVANRSEAERIRNIAARLTTKPIEDRLVPAE